MTVKIIISKSEMLFHKVVTYEEGIYEIRIQLGFYYGKLRCRLGLFGSARIIVVIFNVGKYSWKDSSAIQIVFDSICTFGWSASVNYQFDYKTVWTGAG